MYGIYLRTFTIRTNQMLGKKIPVPWSIWVTFFYQKSDPFTVEEYNPYWQKSITEQYTSLCTSLPGSELVPVGPAWQRARELRGNLPLYDADQSHPSALGQYLTACVFYGVFTKKSPLGLPNRLTCEDRTGEKIYLNIQAETGRPVR